MKKSMYLVAALAGLVFSAGAHAASFPNIDLNRALGAAKDAGTALTGIPEKDEIALGRELAGRTLGAAPLVKDARLQGYVNRVGRSIAAQSDRPDLPWRFGVMDTPGVNAFAAPGGVILVTRGLYALLDNEAQLAAVLGHEVAHVMKRHHVEVMRKQAGGSALAGIGQTYLSARGADRTGLLDKAIGTGAELFARGLDRDAEHEADYVGTLLAAKAGYNMSGMIDVLHKLQARAGDPSTNLLFETHPHPNDRLTKLGDSVAPQMANLAEGSEPPLQVAASSLPAPAATASRAAPTAGARALSPEQQQAQQEPPGGGTTLPNSLLGGQRGGGGNPVEALRGLFGR